MKEDLSTLTDFSFNTISEKASLKQALEQLDKVLVKILFVMENDVFVAALTDGDVRRAILAGALLDTSISQIANYNPQYLEYDDANLAHKRLGKINALPVVDKERKILKVYIKGGSR